MPHILRAAGPSPSRSLRHPVRRHERQDDERSPACPVCNNRLVILRTSTIRDADNQPVRRQVWGCPRGHSMATRAHGIFDAVRVLSDAED